MQGNDLFRLERTAVTILSSLFFCQKKQETLCGKERVWYRRCKSSRFPGHHLFIYCWSRGGGGRETAGEEEIEKEGGKSRDVDTQDRKLGGETRKTKTRPYIKHIQRRVDNRGRRQLVHSLKL